MVARGFSPQLRRRPSGRSLSFGHQRGDNVAVFRVDRKTGWLAFTGHDAAVGNPSSIVSLDLIASRPPQTAPMTSGFARAVRILYGIPSAVTTSVVGSCSATVDPSPVYRRPRPARTRRRTSRSRCRPRRLAGVSLMTPALRP